MQTLEELEAELGEQLRKLRLHRNLEQAAVAEQAGVSVRALRNLEGGKGSTVRTLLAVLRAMGRESWLGTVAPVASVNPLSLTRGAHERQRATSASRRQGARKPVQP